ncbi:MAG: hypothetical protein WCZ20_01335 [Hydrogenophaga sp.]|nr:hypothetical protein [Ottowia sp.]
MLTKTTFLALAFLALSGCAALDAAHIEGQKQDAAKYSDYADVEYQKQVAVQECFKKAGSDTQIAFCAMFGQSTGMASTFGGRPTATAIAPTTGQMVKDTLTGVAPYAAAAAIVKSATSVQAKDPITVTQPEPVIVRPEVVHPAIVHSTASP